MTTVASTCPRGRRWLRAPPRHTLRTSTLANGAGVGSTTVLRSRNLLLGALGTSCLGPRSARHASFSGRPRRRAVAFRNPLVARYYAEAATDASGATTAPTVETPAGPAAVQDESEASIMVPLRGGN